MNQPNLSLNLNMGGNKDPPVPYQLVGIPCSLNISSTTSQTNELLAIDKDDDASGFNVRSPNKRKLLPGPSHGSSKVQKIISEDKDSDQFNF
jgi:hypothetical protein